MRLLVLALAVSGVRVRALEPLCRGDAAANQNAGCKVESGSFLGVTPPAAVGKAPRGAALVVAQFNVNYNGEGGEGDPHKQDGLDGIEAMLRALAPDIITLSEVERGCSLRYGNGAEELARRIGMAWAYGVEFVLLGDGGGGGNGTSTECTTGNAVLSRYPLRSVSQLLFAAQCCAYSGRANGRSALSAVATLPGGLSVGIHSAHLESGSESEFLPAVVVRAQQARELARAALDMAASQGLDVTVIGGDMNMPFRQGDPGVISFKTSGFADAHESVRPSWRSTTEGAGEDGFRQRLGLSVLDYLFVHPREAVEPRHSGVCHDKDICLGWSDHVAIWTVLRVGAGAGLGAEAIGSAQRAALAVPFVPFEADWLWLCSALVWPGLLVHFLVAMRRPSTPAHAQARVDSFVERLSPALPWPPLARRTTVEWLVTALSAAHPLALLLSVALSAAGLVQGWRDFGAWCSFLACALLAVVQLQLLRPFSSAARRGWLWRSTVLLLDAVCTCTWSAALAYWSLTFPAKVAGAGPAAAAASWVLDTMLYALQPLWAALLVRRYRAPIQTCDSRFVGLVPSLLLVGFMTLDYAWSAAPSPYQGYAVLSADCVLGAAYWAAMLLVQLLFGLALRRLARGPAGRDPKRASSSSGDAEAAAETTAETAAEMAAETAAEMAAETASVSAAETAVGAPAGGDQLLQLRRAASIA